MPEKISLKQEKWKNLSIAIGDVYKVSPSALTAAVKVPGCPTSRIWILCIALGEDGQEI